eukprot:TRINITY_DN42302_c0_g1_i1.p1 TRINITY_DN42302_c0_g1~~TRINITY_DN42302_c0_g1_i1.p1  ORF type:complete len:675 (-),score=114.55 TRINITY_DN42302_c0_g1_i1:315-2339(-)
MTASASLKRALAAALRPAARSLEDQVGASGRREALGSRLRCAYRAHSCWPSHGTRTAARGNNWRGLTTATHAPDETPSTESFSSSAQKPSQKVATGTRVDDLKISEAMKQNLYGIGITRLSEIQMRAFEPILQGRSFVGRSRTGTGKTIAFLLPLLERMRQEKIASPHSVLVLVPTRELCKQVGSTILSLSVGADVALVYGGPTLASQEVLVRSGPAIVVSTPGRCARLIEREAIQKENVKTVIVDEADAMLGLEFLGRVEKVFSGIQKQGLQGIIFSASMSEEVLTVVGRHFPDHRLVDLVDRGGLRGTATVEAVVHSLCRVPQDHNQRLRGMLHILNRKMDELGGRCIVFADSTSEAQLLLTHPVLDRKARVLHSESTTQERDIVFTSFANREFDLLVATDVVARGIDFGDITLVIQLHPPRDAAQYVHRAGRTGRAGNGGECVVFFDKNEAALVKRIRQTTRQKFQVEEMPSTGDMHHLAVNRLLDELLAVQTEENDGSFEESSPVMAEASRLLDKHGPNIFATALAMLDGRHADVASDKSSAPSMLTGRKGYVCFLAYDPEHNIVNSEEEVRKILLSMLPMRAGQYDAIGKVIKTGTGYAMDVRRDWAAVLSNDIRVGRTVKTVPFELSIAREMPRLSRSLEGIGRRSRRLPWAVLRKGKVRPTGKPAGL